MKSHKASSIIAFSISGIISGALLQLREYFHVNCHQQEMIVTSLIIGGLVASLVGGNAFLIIHCIFNYHFVCANLISYVLLFIRNLSHQLMDNLNHKRNRLIIKMQAFVYLVIVN